MIICDICKDNTKEANPFTILMCPEEGITSGNEKNTVDDEYDLCEMCSTMIARKIKKEIEIYKKNM